MGLELCGVCGETETGRLIEGIPVCGRCFVEGGLNFPKNQKILKKVYDSPYKETEPRADTPAEGTTPPSPESATKEPVADQGFGDYPCPQCKVTHRAGSKVHKRHLKLL